MIVEKSAIEEHNSLLQKDQKRKFDSKKEDGNSDRKTLSGASW